MGAAQCGFSGGEPLVRQDLAELIGEARGLGDLHQPDHLRHRPDRSTKIADFKTAGLDHIQISFQASDEQVNNLLAGSKKAFAQKLEMARAVKAHGYPMVLNFVTHRHNIDQHRPHHRAVHRPGSRLRRTRHLPVLRLGPA